MNGRILRRELMAALEGDAIVDATRLGVAVADGIVTLTGQVPTYALKCRAARVALSVRNVRAVADRIEVRCHEALSATDEELAERVARIVERDERIAPGSVKVVVEKGCITLRGTVPCEHQKAALDRATSRLPGARGVVNLLGIRPVPREDEVKAALLSALKRSARHRETIRVLVEGDVVTLDGRVDHPGEREIAERAAGSVPGVRVVEDRLVLP